MQNEYTSDSFKKITDNYIEIFGNDFFDALPQIVGSDEYGYNILISDPRKLTYQEAEELYNTQLKNCADYSITKIKDLLQGQGFSLGLTPWTDYYLSIRAENERGKVLVVGHDWYPLRDSLTSPLVIQKPENEQQRKKAYQEAFALITNQNYLPVFINLIPGLRDENERTDKDNSFKKYHCMEYLEAVFDAVKPSVTVTWGRPVCNRIIENYGPFESKFDIGKGVSKLTLKGRETLWVPMYHPSAWQGQHNWDCSENNYQKSKLTELLT